MVSGCCGAVLVKIGLEGCGRWVWMMVRSGVWCVVLD